MATPVVFASSSCGLLLCRRVEAGGEGRWILKNDVSDENQKAKIRRSAPPYRYMLEDFPANSRHFSQRSRPIPTCRTGGSRIVGHVSSSLPPSDLRNSHFPESFVPGLQPWRYVPSKAPITSTSTIPSTRCVSLLPCGFAGTDTGTRLAGSSIFPSYLGSAVGIGPSDFAVMQM